MEALLSVKDLCAGYGRREILHGLSLSFLGGQITVLAGPNGCGKSTLLKTLTGLVPKGSGSVLIGGRPMEQLPASARARHGAAWTLCSSFLSAPLP